MLDGGGRVGFRLAKALGAVLALRKLVDVVGLDSRKIVLRNCAFHNFVFFFK